MTRIAAWLDAHAAPEWRVGHKLWSVRIAAFWGAMNGLYAALPAFSSTFPPGVFLALNVGLAIALVVARFTRQPGADL